MVEETQHATITISNSNGQKNGTQICCGTMIQHSTICANGEDNCIKSIPNLSETNEVDGPEINGISSKIETIVINSGETHKQENISMTNGSLKKPPGGLSNPQETCSSTTSSYHIKQDIPGVFKTSNSKKSSGLCDIEIAEQLYMNANMISRNALFSNRSNKEELKLEEILDPSDEFSTDQPKERSFKYIKCLSTSELKSKLQNLDHEMELEIKRITKRYEAKRKPIVDGIDEKRKQQQNF